MRVLGQTPSKRNNEIECVISNKEIAQAFVLRTSDFSNKNTKCALIVTSKVLYNLNAKEFRHYFLQKYYLDKVFELAPVAQEVFDSANAPATILFFRYAHLKPTQSNKTIYYCLKPNPLFSIFKIFIFQNNDIKKITQKILKEYDWLWNVLLYGNYLDFNLIKRLKKEFTTIENHLKRGNILYGQGIIVGDKDKRYNTERYIGSFLINHKKDIEQFHVIASDKWTEKEVTRKRNKDLFVAPFLLVKHSFKEFKAIAAISNFDALYKHSLTGIKGDLNSLRVLCGLLNSDFFKYYALINSIAGIDRGRAHDKEKFNFPFTGNYKTEKLVKQIEEITEQLYIAKQELFKPEISSMETGKRGLLDELNNEIFNSFDLNQQELSLVDYAINITIPMIMRHKGYEDKVFSPVKNDSDILGKYINVFINRFEETFNKIGLKLSIEVWNNKNVIGLFFKEIPEKGAKKDTIIINKESSMDDLLCKISSLGINKITEQLFIRKDIRGFEEDGFFIIKPNEKQLWHKAVAYLDMLEFADAILRAGSEKVND